MANDLRRSRSNTSISTKSNRPISRASTASLHSFDQHDHSQNPHSRFPQHPHHPHSFPAHYNTTTYAPLEPALLQAAQHASQDLSMDSVQQLMAFSADGTAHPPAALQHQPFDPNQAALVMQSSMTQRQPSVASMGPSVVDAEETNGKKKKGSASGSATNDKELREMLVKNDGRALKEVAAEVIATDRTSRAEKSKQLFAMLWLKSVCKTAKTSVPRNRVYSKYAERCGTERVIPLNPASFGKLVRVIFPGIQTRRLGVRGESKYHYVDLALINDSEDGPDGRRSANGQSTPALLGRQHSSTPKLDFNAMPRLPADTAAYPQQDQSFENQPGFFSQTTSRGRLFTDIYSEQYRSASSRSTPMWDYDLKFATPEQMAPEDNASIVLPDISPYLPTKTDPDAAEALVALYRTHCTSLIDSVRYCKEKQFFRLFTSFHGTLTVPVQKLFAQPEIAPWIRECDWMMYQKMIRNVSQLTLQVAPPPVLKFLDNVSKMLYPHLSKIFCNLPNHTLDARLEPATLFSHLLRQMLRVNSTAHAAAVMLMGDSNREQMWGDWKAYVNVKRIIENELPSSCGHEDVLNILSTEIRALLLPLPTETWLPNGVLHREPMPDIPDLTNETVIDRIAAFLTRLPSRFPHAPARIILHCVNALGSAALREITVENGQSFQGWWLTKVFIDEMGQWLASLGGFLDHTPPTVTAMTYSPGLLGDSMNTDLTNGGSGSNQESRYSSMDADFGPNQSFMSTNTVTLPDAGHVNANTEIHSRRYPEQCDQVSFNLDLDFSTSQQEPNHDDSGIHLEDGIDMKFATAMRSQFSQLPAGAS